MTISLEGLGDSLAARRHRLVWPIWARYENVKMVT
jgi:hypothetical protein